MLDSQVIVIPAYPEPEGLDMTAIGIAVGLGLYGLIGIGLTLLSIAQIYGWM